MDLDKKMQFLQNMTHMALTHAAATSNVATPTGGMSHEKMMDFVRKVAEKGIQHFDSGGTTAGGLGGAVSGFLGTNNGFQAQQANITPGTNAGQLSTAYTGAQGALGQQENITNTLTPGVSQGANTQSNLTNMLTAQANGQGPNPAQAQLNQTTGQNIAQQAALAAGVRGSGANAGLIAAQNAQQGAATQQQAVGQAATLGAQQQLAAESNLQNLAGTEVTQGQSAVQGVNNAQQNEQNILQNANTAANNANVSATANYNNVNAGISTANQNAASQSINGLAGIGSTVGSIAGLFAKGGMVKMDKGGKVLDANARAHIADHNFALPGGRYPIHDENHARNALARVAQNGTPEEKAKVKAAVHKKYPSIGEKKMAKGGEVSADKKQVERKPMVMPPQRYADGGLTGQALNPSQSFVGNWLNSSTQSGGPTQTPLANLNTDISNPLAAAGDLQAAPSKVTDPTANTEDITDEGESDLSTVGDPTDSPSTSMSGNPLAEAAQRVGAQGGISQLLPLIALAANKGGLMKAGGKVKPGKGEEAEVPGDSLKNDKVPAMLSSGEIVIPRHITMGPNAPARAAQFVAQQLSKRGGK